MAQILKKNRFIFASHAVRALDGGAVRPEVQVLLLHGFPDLNGACPHFLQLLQALLHGQRVHLQAQCCHKKEKNRQAQDCRHHG